MKALLQKPKAVVFDFDGTLVDHSSRRLIARKLASSALDDSGLADSTPARPSQSVRDLIELPELVALDVLHPGVHYLLKSLSSTLGLKVVIYSARQFKDLLLDQIEAYELTNLVDHIVTSEGRAKSCSDLVHQLPEIDFVMMAGDSREDLEVAEGLKVPFVRVQMEDSANGVSSQQSDWGGSAVGSMEDLYGRIYATIILNKVDHMQED